MSRSQPNSFQPTILLLREGTDTSQGKGQLISNINACTAIVDAVRTTLGPRGMDKLVVEAGGKVTISNDGATVMKLLDIVHPAAKTMVDIAKAQDAEVGDGTTSVVVVAGELLKEAKRFVEEGVHPTTIIRAYRVAAQLSRNKIRELAVPLDAKDPADRRRLLERCAATSMNSKLIGSHSAFFAPMVVNSVLCLDDDQDNEMIGIKKETGGSMEDSFLVEGVAFKKTFSYAGFEQQPKCFRDPKILALNVELELKPEKGNAEIRLNKVDDYQSVIDAEWKLIYDKLERIVKTGAKVVLSKLAIGDLATQYFADRDIFSAGRVDDSDLRRVSKSTGAQILTSINSIDTSSLGSCSLFEERQVGGHRYNVFSGCPQAKSSTMVLRGGGEQFIDEMERSIHDAIMIVRRAVKHSSVVGGGGAIELELSKYLREHSRTIHGKQQLIINAYARALEVIPRQIAENAGLDATTLLNKLRKEHVQGQRWAGVDIIRDDVCNTFDSFIWEPSLVKLNALESATEAACLILSVDETIKAPRATGQLSEDAMNRNE